MCQLQLPGARSSAIPPWPPPCSTDYCTDQSSSTSTAIPTGFATTKPPQTASAAPPQSPENRYTDHAPRWGISVSTSGEFRRASSVSRYIEHQTGWSIKKFVRTARRYRTVKIKAGQQTLTAASGYPTTSAARSARSAPAVCTNLSQAGDDGKDVMAGARGGPRARAGGESALTKFRSDRRSPQTIVFNKRSFSYCSSWHLHMDRMWLRSSL